MPVLVAIAAFALGPKPLPFPRAWLGRWEGPAVLMGGHHGRMRLVFFPDGRLELSEIEREKDGRLHRTANAGEVRRTCQGYELKGMGTLVDADSPTGSMASEIVFWYLRRLQLRGGTLSGIAQEDRDVRKRSEQERFLLRRVR